MKKSTDAVRNLFSITGAGGMKADGEAAVTHAIAPKGARVSVKDKPASSTITDRVTRRRSAATRPLSPATATALKGVGEAVRNARKARKLTIEELAKRSGIAKKTMLAIEGGAGSTSTAALFEVISVLDTGLIETFVDALRADPVGKALLDARLPTRTRPERF